MIVDPATSDARGCAHTFQDPVLRVLIVARNGCHTLSTYNQYTTNQHWLWYLAEYDRIHESNGMSPSPDDNRDSICFWNSILLLERRKIGLSHSISAFESVKPLSKSASKYDFNSFQLVLFRVQKRTRYIILIPCTRIILENTFIQGNVKLTRAYIRRKRIV